MSAIPTRWTPAASTALYRESRSTRSERNESSDENRTWTPSLEKKTHVSLGSAQSAGIRNRNIPLEVLDDLNGRLLNVGHALAVREFTEEARGTNDKIDTVDTSAVKFIVSLGLFFFLFFPAQ